MYRVALSAFFITVLTGCSLGSSNPLTLGFGGVGTNAGSGGSMALGDKTPLRPASPKTQVASLQDNAPRGSYEKAKSGALASRDYTATKLDAEKARDLINAYRKEKGLKPLRINMELTNAAKAHSRDLARWDRISHFGSDGSNPWDRVKRTGYNARLAAENVGTGQVSIEEVIKGWKASEGHNKNLLMPDAQHMGIALVQDPRTEFKTFWTLVLGSSS